MTNTLDDLIVGESMVEGARAALAEIKEAMHTQEEQGWKDE